MSFFYIYIIYTFMVIFLNFIIFYIHCNLNLMTGGHGFNHYWIWQHFFREINYEIHVFSTVILPLPVIQEDNCQFLTKEYAQILVNHLED